MKKSKLVKAAEGAKKDGYEFMSVIVKYESKKPLYHLVAIDVILKFEEWPPARAKLITPEDGTKPFMGIKLWTKSPEKTIAKSEAIRKYCK